MAGTVPTRNGGQLDAFNAQMRSSPIWQMALKKVGADPSRPIRLSDSQRRSVQNDLAANGVQFPGGMQIDPAGNINQDQGVSAAWDNPLVKYPLIAGAALTGAGALGIGPLSGLLSVGGGASAAAGTAAGLGTVAGTAAPVAAASGFWSPTTIGLLNAGIGVGTNLIGAKMQSGAANRAAQMQQQSNADTLAFLRDQDTKDRAQYGEERSRLWGQQDVDRTRAEENRQLLMLREREREGRLAPFRSRDSGAYRRLSDLVVG